MKITATIASLVLVAASMALFAAAEMFAVVHTGPVSAIGLGLVGMFVVSAAIAVFTRSPEEIL